MTSHLQHCFKGHCFMISVIFINNQKKHVEWSIQTHVFIFFKLSI